MSSSCKRHWWRKTFPSEESTNTRLNEDNERFTGGRVEMSITHRWHLADTWLHTSTYDEIIIIIKFVQKYTSYKKKIKVKKTKLTSTNSTNNKIQLMRVQQLHTLAIPMNIKKLYRHVSAVTVWQTQVTLCYLYIVMCQQWRVQCDRLR